MGESFIKWLSSVNKGDSEEVGEKAKNLGMLFNNGFSVPQAFIVTTDAFFFFLKETKLDKIIIEILNSVDFSDIKQTKKKCEEIFNLIVSAKMPPLLEEMILESYDSFNVSLKNLKDSPGALAILRSAREPVFVSVRSSVFRGTDSGFCSNRESFMNVKGNYDLIDRIKRVFASFFNFRSLLFKKQEDFKMRKGISVIVQKMINSEKSGVVFSKHPVSFKDNLLIESVFGQGEGIVSGKVNPDKHLLSLDLEIINEDISKKDFAIIRNASGQTKLVELKEEFSVSRVLKTSELKQVANCALKIEDFFEEPMIIEFAIEDGEVFILGAFPFGETITKGHFREIDGKIILRGNGVSGGISNSQVKIINSEDDFYKIKEGDILVSGDLNPDNLILMNSISGVISSQGGFGSFIARASRSKKIPCVLGAKNALEVLHDGMEVSIDGFNGNVFLGAVQDKNVEVLPVVETDTKVKLAIDSLNLSEMAFKTACDGVGLLKIEGIILESGKYPLFYKKNNLIGEYEEVLKRGLKNTVEKFIGKPVWVRLTDYYGEDFSGLEGYECDEKNSLLGLFGIRFLLENEDIFRAELRAIKSLSDFGYNLGILISKAVSIEEIKKAREIFDEEGCSSKVGFGVVIDNPALCILIKDVIKEKIDFVSFDLSCLTQYTLIVDKLNDKVNHLYNEMSWAVLKQVSRVIRECKQKSIKTSIYGCSVSKPEMLEFLLKQGIDSVCVNFSDAHNVSKIIKRIEDGEILDEIQENESLENEKLSEDEENGVVEINEGNENEIDDELDINESIDEINEDNDIEEENKKEDIFS